MQTVLPNHSLTYNIGSSFCLEDPIASDLRLSIFCPLENDPVPQPTFSWTVMQKILSGHVTLWTSIHSNQDLLIINGTFLELENDTDIIVTCTINNTLGSDNSTTIIQLCGKL